jgi:hypothetical protein
MFDMDIAWYYQAWCWVGLGAAIVLLILLFTTNVLRNNLNNSRWKDPVWLAWFVSAGYLLHNAEEYGIDLTGVMYAFPKSAETVLETGFSGAYYMAVNLSLIWFVFPIAAALSRKYRMMPVGMAAFMFINAIGHIASIAMQGYNPGVFTSIVLFIPLAIWTFYVCVGKGKLKYSALLYALCIGVLATLLLLVSTRIYEMAGTLISVIFLVLNAALVLYLWYAAQKIAGGKLVEIKQYP